MKTISTQELQRRLDEDNAAVFDVRGDVEYEYGHIPGAHTAPLGSLVFRVARVMNPGSFVAVYANGDDDLGAQAAERLEDLGMTNVHVYEDGLQGWQKAGQKIIESAFPKEQARGPVVDVRPLVVDRERAYGGVFASEPVEDAGGGG